MKQSRHLDYNDAVITSTWDFATSKQEKWVLSSYSAASLWGFNNQLFKGLYLTFPKGDVSNKFAKFRSNPKFHIKQRSNELYYEGIVKIECDGYIVLAYEPERAFVEIIKDIYTKLDDIAIDLIRKFYTTINYDFEKLMRYAKMFGIEDVISMSVALGGLNG